MSAIAKINWRGTDVSLSFDCTCGASSHFEGLEAAVLKCVSCEQHWEMPDRIQPKQASQDARPVSMTLSR
jgi:hypothetical protein